jgi:hypothetical protein
MAMYGSGTVWLVGTGWAAPLVEPGENDSNRDVIDWVMTTVIARPRRPKADVRAWREQCREEMVA